MRTTIFASSILTLAAATASAQAPCGEWSTQFAPPGLDAPPVALVSHDDGSGPALYAAGPFTSAGGVDIESVARWNGAAWSTVGGGLPGTRALAVFDDGNGAQLYAGGSFRTVFGAPANTIARWNGTSWSALPGSGLTGENETVASFAVHDDGGGAALYASGRLRVPGSATVHRVVRWNPSSGWQPVTTGIVPTTDLPQLAVFDDGGGERLFAGIDNPSTSGLQSWNGSSWTNVIPAPAGIRVRALARYTDSGGPALYVGGQFTSIAGTVLNSIARFDGTSFTSVGGGVTAGGVAPGQVLALAVHDDGGGARLYVGGLFDAAGALPVNGLAAWNGTSWSGVQPLLGKHTGVASLASFDDGGGSALFVSGYFQRAGPVGAKSIARWRQQSWSALASGAGLGANASGLVEFDDGSGPALYAAGFFDAAGSTAVRGVARWNGTSWRAIGRPDYGADELFVFDDGSGPALHAVGAVLEGVARWNGLDWTPVGNGVSGPILATCVFDAGGGPALFVSEVTPASGFLSSNILRLNGAVWGLVGSFTGRVGSLRVHDDGSGPALYAAASTLAASPGPAVARWDGTTWTPVGTNIVSAEEPDDLASVDLGNGPELFLAARVLLAGGGSVTPLVRWDGASWVSLGLPASAFRVASLRAFHDGVGPRLLAAIRNSLNETRLSTWDGAQWADVPGVVQGATFGLATADLAGDGVPDVYVTGIFERADGKPSAHIASWIPCGTRGEVVCAGDGSAAACPCGNAGASGSGCGNSLHAGGARLTNGGLASLASDTLTLAATDLTGTSVLFAQGSAIAGGGTGTPFDDGILCLAGSVVRLGTVFTSGGGATLPAPGGTPLSTSGGVLVPGTTRIYQARYRNVASFCTPGTSNFTNALRVTWSL
ncbi:MAG: hypothetical protein JNK02_03270 [Planctomycetes bacterium]|nr:hypothetical protein [Planctomycetota bacterium]